MLNRTYIKPKIVIGLNIPLDLDPETFLYIDRPMYPIFETQNCVDLKKKLNEIFGTRKFVGL
jgi:hypothetical protein